MAVSTDSYQTIVGDACAQVVEQRSRFLSFAYHVTDSEQIRNRIELLQKEYCDARHICYAYMLGPERIEFRVNDNGEPSGTAGRPILGQINSAGLTDILIAVVRYFGGVKLGTSGLAEAYRQAARMALQNADCVTRYVESELRVLFNYDSMNDVMKVVKDLELAVSGQDYGVFDGYDRKRQEPMLFECSMTLRGRVGSINSASERFMRLAEPMPVPNLYYEISDEPIARI